MKMQFLLPRLLLLGGGMGNSFDIIKPRFAIDLGL